MNGSREASSFQLDWANSQFFLPPALNKVASESNGRCRSLHPIQNILKKLGHMRYIFQYKIPKIFQLEPQKAAPQAALFLNLYGQHINKFRFLTSHKFSGEFVSHQQGVQPLKTLALWTQSPKRGWTTWNVHSKSDSQVCWARRLVWNVLFSLVMEQLKKSVTIKFWTEAFDQKLNNSHRSLNFMRMELLLKFTALLIYFARFVSEFMD